MEGDFLKSIIGLAGVPVIVGLVQLFKGFISDTRWYPVAAIGLGLAINITAAWALGADSRIEFVSAAMQGILTGLSASGLYSAGTALKEGDLADKNKRTEAVG